MKIIYDDTINHILIKLCEKSGYYKNLVLRSLDDIFFADFIDFLDKRNSLSDLHKRLCWLYEGYFLRSISNDNMDCLKDNVLFLLKEFSRSDVLELIVRDSYMCERFWLYIKSNPLSVFRFDSMFQRCFFESIDGVFPKEKILISNNLEINLFDLQFTKDLLQQIYSLPKKPDCGENLFSVEFFDDYMEVTYLGNSFRYLLIKYSSEIKDSLNYCHNYSKLFELVFSGDVPLCIVEDFLTSSCFNKGEDTIDGQLFLDNELCVPKDFGNFVKDIRSKVSFSQLEYIPENVRGSNRKYLDYSMLSWFYQNFR